MTPGDTGVFTRLSPFIFAFLLLFHSYILSTMNGDWMITGLQAISGVAAVGLIVFGAVVETGRRRPSNQANGTNHDTK